MDNANTLTKEQRELVRVALAERARGLAKQADPQNPWFDEGAAKEVAELRRLERQFAAPLSTVMDDEVEATLK